MRSLIFALCLPLSMSGEMLKTESYSTLVPSRALTWDFTVSHISLRTELPLPAIRVGLTRPAGGIAVLEAVLESIAVSPVSEADLPLTSSAFLMYGEGSGAAGASSLRDIDSELWGRNATNVNDSAGRLDIWSESDAFMPDVAASGLTDFASWLNLIGNGLSGMECCGSESAGGIGTSTSLDNGAGAGTDSGNVTDAVTLAVPEPGSWTLLTLGLSFLLLRGGRRQQGV